MSIMALDSGLIMLGVTFLLGAFVVWVVATVFGGADDPQPSETKGMAAGTTPEATSSGTQASQDKKTPHNHAARKKADRKAPAKTHPYLIAALKGHTASVTGVTFTLDEKYIATLSEDRTLRLWPCKSLTEKPPACVRFNIDLDHATSVSFSMDSRACVVALGQENKLRVYKVDPKRKQDDSFELKRTIPEKGALSAPIVGCGLSVGNPQMNTGCRYIMAATADTSVKYFSLGGDVLQSIDTKMMHHTHACLSPDGRYTAVCGYIGDVRLMEVDSKAGSFIKASVVADVGGHRSEVYYCSFTPCSKALCSVSKDGTWSAIDIDVDFARGASARRLGGGTYTHRGPSACALSPDKSVVAVGTGAHIEIYSVETSQLLETIDGAHTGGRINRIEFDGEGKYIASSGGFDKRAYVFQNVPGQRVALAELERSLLKPGTATAKRILGERVERLKQTLAPFA